MEAASMEAASREAASRAAASTRPPPARAGGRLYPPLLVRRRWGVEGEGGALIRDLMPGTLIRGRVYSLTGIAEWAHPFQN